MFVKAFGSALSLNVIAVVAQTYSATYTPGNAPDRTQEGQIGTNKCGDGSDQKSKCQNTYLNSLDDCVFASPEPGADSVIGNTERIEVAWCIKPGYGTRVIPDGAILGAHFVQTPDYVQITGTGDLTKINVPAGDQGGELDPHGADGNGNPIGGLVFSSAFGQMEQLHEWTSSASADAKTVLTRPLCANISMTRWAAIGTCRATMPAALSTSVRAIPASPWECTVSQRFIKVNLPLRLHTPCRQRQPASRRPLVAMASSFQSFPAEPCDGWHICTLPFSSVQSSFLFSL